MQSIRDLQSTLSLILENYGNPYYLATSGQELNPLAAWLRCGKFAAEGARGDIVKLY